MMPENKAPAAAPPQSPAEAKSPPGPGRTSVAVALILYGGLGLWGASARDFWQGEVEHALAFREMEASFAGSARGVARGTAGAAPWLTPTLFGEPHLSRPPLAHWLAAGTGALAGFDPEIAYRIPEMLFSLLGLWLTFALGKALFDRRVGFLAMVLQGTTCLYFLKSSWLGSDLIFIVCAQLAITGFYLSLDEGRSSAWKTGGWLGLAGASLSGSPVGALALVSLPLVIAFFLSGGLGAVKEGIRRIARGWGWILFAVLVAPWYIYQCAAHTSAFQEQFIEGAHLAPFTDGGYPGRSPLFYLLVLLLGFLPWIVFLPLGLLHGKDRRTRPGERLAFYWLLAALIGLSIIPAKAPAYLLFAFPAICLLIPAALYETGEQFSVWEEILQRWGLATLPVILRLPLLIFAAGVLLVLVGGAERIFAAELRAELDATPETLARAAIPFLGAAVAFLLSFRVKKLSAAGDIPIAVFETGRGMFFFFIAAAFLLPFFDPIESPRAFLEAVADRADKAPLATYGSERPAAPVYYLEKPVRHFEALDPRAGKGAPGDRPRELLQNFVEQPAPVFLLMPERALEGLEIQFPGLASEIFATGIRGRMAGEAYVLLANRPDPAAEG